jgi:hypothetical protein
MRKLLGHLRTGLGTNTWLKTKMQPIGERLQDCANVTEQLTHHALPALHEAHVCNGMDKAFADVIREHSMNDAPMTRGTHFKVCE